MPDTPPSTPATPSGAGAIPETPKRSRPPRDFLVAPHLEEPDGKFFDWGSRPAQFAYRRWATNEGLTIMTIPNDKKPNMSTYDMKAVEVPKWKSIRQAWSIIAAPGSVNRSGTACCEQCISRMEEKASAHCGCITRAANAKGRCAECAAASTACSFGGSLGAEGDREEDVVELVRLIGGLESLHLILDTAITTGTEVSPVLLEALVSTAIAQGTTLLHHLDPNATNNFDVAHANLRTNNRTASTPYSPVRLRETNLQAHHTSPRRKQANTSQTTPVSAAAGPSTQRATGSGGAKRQRLEQQPGNNDNGNSPH